MKISSINRFSRGASWLLIFYLSFVISGCAYRPAELTPEQARVLQTRDFNGSPAEVAKAASVVLQEMHYTVGNVDMGLGLMTASRTSERSLAPISRETGAQSDFESELGTFCLIAGTIAVVGLFLAWMFDAFDGDNDDDDDDNDDRRHPQRSHRSRSHNHDSNFFWGSDNSSSSGADSYTYTMTVNLEELSLQQTRVRLTVQGEHYEGSSIVESGPVQDQQFFIDFFTRLHTSLNR
ncbi:MAG: hypothetical protein HOD43_04250 [Candidatus Marinimicrobia bacterium]|jgi:hypothetical protein|nr:hypothetical protein [Candidatus Neomarinimicrobiota bacterium]MBT3629950.1 hypothetical protein [Candidatus Neomarinimicrobiota bacterium]MBT3825561.1 hypothetical protein [Candidatus Neomarinimicrobiota bacterium]MBT4130987.1 hypothetical protein [Candidatus Neomarinimicrobiota bacterium]MBT4294996.1 hypothetical protein [Candidatus Neomarinimicrobiota bacterium]